MISFFLKAAGYEAPAMDAKYCQTGSATLFDLGLKTEASFFEFAAKVADHFGIPRSALGMDVFAMMPTLSELAEVVKDAIPAVVATKSVVATGKASGGGLLPANSLRAAACLVLIAASTVSATATSSLSCLKKTPTVATEFTYEDFGTYKVVNSTRCGESYVLYKKTATPPALCSGSAPGVKCFGTPLEKVILATTVATSFIETLNARDKIAVVSEYTTSACLAKMVSDGTAVKYVSHDSDAAAHAAIVGDASYEAIFSDPWGTSQWSNGHAASEGKVVCASANFEENPVGSAEWIKFYAAFFEAEEIGVNAFCGRSSRYSCASMAASANTARAASLGIQALSYQPTTVLFASFQAGWNGAPDKYKLNLPPFKTNFIQSSGAYVPDLSAFAAYQTMHWSGSYVDGYTFSLAQIDDFHAALRTADVVIDETYPNQQSLASITTAYKLDTALVGAMPKAFVSGRVYTLDGTMDSRAGQYGGSDWYESRTAEPDTFLDDLIKVAHAAPGFYAPTGMTYLRHAATGVTVPVTASMCADVSAPRPVKAATCEALAATNTVVLGWLATFNAALADALAPAAAAPLLLLPTEDNTALIAGMSVLAVCLGLALLLVVLLACKASKAPAATAAAKGTACSTSSSASSAATKV